VSSKPANKQARKQASNNKHKQSINKTLTFLKFCVLPPPAPQAPPHELNFRCRRFPPDNSFRYYLKETGGNENTLTAGWP